MILLKQKSNCFLIGLLILLCFLIGSCSKKAKLIQVGAAQFEAQSHAAIDGIDKIRSMEIKATELSPEKATDFFLNGVKNSKKPITMETLKILTDPKDLGSMKSEEQWQMFLQKIRNQYRLFSVTFSSLDKGSLFAASEVKKTIPILDKLVGQMASFAQSIKDQPAEFVRERAGVAAEIEMVRETFLSVPPPDQAAIQISDLKLKDLERRLREIEATEKQLSRDAMAKALQAATLGTQLRRLLLDYDKINMDDISDGLTMAFKLAAEIPGLDIQGLQTKTELIVQEIDKDSDLKSFFNIALTQMNAAREK